MIKKKFNEYYLRLAWLLVWGWRTINRLTDAPDCDWTVVKTKEKQ